MNRILTSLLLLTLLSSVVSCKVNRALSFDGVNDYVDLGNIYDHVEFPITISAWIFVDSTIKSQTPIFVSQDNGPLYKGFHFVINPTHLFAGYGDGLGENHHAYRRDKSAKQTNSFGKWIYVTGVIRGAEDIEIYLNGENIGGEYTGSSKDPMRSDYPDAVAKIGYWFSNDKEFRYKGLIDDLKIWNSALSEQEIKLAMKKKLTNENANLIGSWSFNERSGKIVYDQSNNKFNGKLMGELQRVKVSVKNRAK